MDKKNMAQHLTNPWTRRNGIGDHIRKLMSNNTNQQMVNNLLLQRLTAIKQDAVIRVSEETQV